MSLTTKKSITALRLAVEKRGYQPVAIHNHDAVCKSPGKQPFGTGWQTRRGQPPLVAIALGTGILCHNVRAIDIDIEDQGLVDRAVAIIESVFGATPLHRFRSNSPRRCLLYRGIGPGKKLKLPGVGEVDIRGTAQQFVAFGIHPTGVPFEWREADPSNTPVDQLPLIGEKAIERCFALLAEAFGATPAPEVPEVPTIVEMPAGDGGDRFRRINDAALANLGSWVPRLFPRCKFQPGTRAYRVSSKSLGRDLQEDLSLAPDGIVEHGVHDMGDPRDGRRTAIDVVLEHGDAQDPVAAARWLGERLGIEFGYPVEVSPEVAASALAIVASAERNKCAPPATPPPDPLASLTLGEDVDWTRPAGLLAEMTEWILETSIRPNRPLAVAAATSVLSVVCGRHLYSPTGSALNVYLAALGDSGIGKNRPLTAPWELLRAAGLKELHTSGKVFSVSGFEQIIIAKPCCLLVIDEIGDELLKPILSRKATPHESRIKSALQILWSRNQGDQPFVTTARANAAGVEVACPSLSLFGASTPEAFYGALTAANVTDGLMNRILIAEAAPRAPRNENQLSRSEVPTAISEALAALKPEMEGNLGETLGVYMLPGEVEGRTLEWESERVRRAALAFEDSILEAKDAKPVGHDLMARIFEYTIRLGSLHAVSRSGLHATVGLRDLEWGAAWAVQSAKLLMSAAKHSMSRNDHEAAVNSVKKAIRESANGTIVRSELLQKVHHIRAHELQGILGQLVESGVILAVGGEAQQGSAPGGRKPTIYHWTGSPAA